MKPLNEALFPVRHPIFEALGWLTLIALTVFFAHLLFN